MMLLMPRITETAWGAKAEDLLGDGQWHDGMTVVRELEKLITPGVARRMAQGRYEARRRRETGEEEPERLVELSDTALIAMGKRYIVQKMVHGKLFSGAWETDQPINGWRGQPGWRLRKVIRYTPSAIAQKRYGISPETMRELIFADPPIPHTKSGQVTYVRAEDLPALEERIAEYRQESRGRISQARRAVLERKAAEPANRYSITHLQRLVNLGYKSMKRLVTAHPDFPWVLEKGARYVMAEDLPEFEKLVAEWLATHGRSVTAAATRRRRRQSLQQQPAAPQFDDAGLTEMYARYRSGESDLRPQVMDAMRQAFHSASEV